MDFLRAVVLGVIQGLTEFLPISSSAHLAIFPKFFGWDDPGAAYTAVIQIGTEIAVVLYFWRDIWTIGSGWVRGLFSSAARAEREWRMGWFVIVGSMPIVLVGLAFESLIDRQFRNLWVIGTTLVVLGIVLGIAERVGRKSAPIDELTWPHAVLFGLAQAAAVVPGRLTFGRHHLDGPVPRVRTAGRDAVRVAVTSSSTRWGTARACRPSVRRKRS